MSNIEPDHFSSFFKALWGLEPFPWQRRLARLLCESGWPECIDLPTASGKTACLDIAVFALALQAKQRPVERSLGRRIFFVVNRRVIVDEAYERACEMARKLQEAKAGILSDVAQSLREISGDPEAPPLDVALLRGGIPRDNRWARSITQPTIIASTVDQIGSRLLFRGYGVSDAAKPLHAALVANDSLLLLDEAHISRPLVETLTAVKRYRGEQWANTPIHKPFDFVQMTATPPESSGEPFALSEDDLAHPVLQRRHGMPKPIRLHLAKKAKGKNAHDGFAKELANAAIELLSERRRNIAVIVNRVATARQVAEVLKDLFKDQEAEIHLAIGRMRPLDRDGLAEAVRARIGKRSSGEANAMPMFVIATQCLEVGADYDFDAMVSECASLDALRQRFGRLNRRGREVDACGTILMHPGQVKEKEDPIYGAALANTWAWLNSAAAGKEKVVDFGVHTLNEVLTGADTADLLSPQATAPVMFPAHVDAWAQTHPIPMPDPDVSLFLHGPQRGEPDVLVCWREDLPKEPEHWAQIVSLCPPSSPECMSVPIGAVRRWLAGREVGDSERSDTLDSRAPEEEGRTEPGKRLALIWRGSEKSKWLKSPAGLLPGDTVVLPTSGAGWEVLGHIPMNAPRDVAETAFQRSSGLTLLRLTEERLEQWPKTEAVLELLGWLSDPDSDLRIPEIRGLLREAAAEFPEGQQELAAALRSLSSKKYGLVFERYPGGCGAVLRTLRSAKPVTTIRALDDGEDESSRTTRSTPVPLEAHLAHVVRELEGSFKRLALPDLEASLRMAAACHDWGKADPRFQALLLNGDLNDAWAQPRLWAKSAAMPGSSVLRRRARERSGLPGRFRHEMLSAQLAQHAALPGDSAQQELVLHLIEAHHGYARPFAPVAADGAPPEVDLNPLGIALRFGGEARAQCPPHRLDSGVAERFWSLTRRFGWWGLAYLEAVLRLADHRASQREDEHPDDPIPAIPQPGVASAPAVAKPDGPGLVLTGLDGGNPLAFLAALGALRTLSLAWPDRPVKMRWVQQAGAWRPQVRIIGEKHCSEDICLEMLESELVNCFEHHPLKQLAGENTARSDPYSTTSYWTSALSSDLAPGATSQLQTVRRDYFVGNLKSIMGSTTKEHLQRALFKQWDYGDALDNQSLHLDPTEDRRYAYQWAQPSGDPARKKSGGMLGANRLAIEAFPLFQSLAVGEKLLTRGFHGTRVTNTRWTWPIWNIPLNCEVVASLLGLTILQEQSPDPRILRACGIVTGYRCRRILVEKTPNLTPSVPAF